MARGAGKGWDYAPGASVDPIVQAAAEKIRHWDYRIGKGFMDDVPEALRDALAASYRSLPSVADDARRFAQRIWGLSEGRIEPLRTLGLVAPRQAAFVRDVLGEDAPDGLALYDYSLAENDLRHVRAQHGDSSREIARGQRAVTPADFALLPRILEAPNAIEDAGQSDTGERLIRYIKLIDGERHSAVFAIRNGRRTLALKTYYIGVKGGDASPR